MANEITVAVSLTASKSNLFVSREASLQATLTGTTFSHQVQAIGTSEEALDISGDVTTAGFTFFRNLDATNYVEIGVLENSVFRALIKLKAGEAALIRLGTSAAYAKANTAAVNLEYLVLAD